jgi:hypothetical protein
MEDSIARKKNPDWITGGKKKRNEKKQNIKPVRNMENGGKI